MSSASTARAEAPPPVDGRVRALCVSAAVAVGAASVNRLRLHLDSLSRLQMMNRGSPFGLGMHPRADFANKAERALGVPMQPVSFPHATEDGLWVEAASYTDGGKHE